MAQFDLKINKLSSVVAQFDQDKEVVILSEAKDLLFAVCKEDLLRCCFQSKPLPYLNARNDTEAGVSRRA